MGEIITQVFRGQWPRRLVLVSGAVLAIGLLLRGLAEVFRQWADVEATLDPRWTGLATAIAVLYWLLGGTAWWATLRALGSPPGVEPLRVKVALRVFFLGNLGRYLPGKFWYVAGRSVLAQQHGMDPTRVDTSSLLELTFIGLSGAIIAVATSPFLAVGAGLAGFAEIAPALALAVILAGLGALHPRVFRLALVVIARLRHAVAPAPPPFRAMVGLLAGYLGVWSIAGCALWATVAAVAPIGWTQLPAILGVWAFAYLAGFVAPITPAGIGIREATGAALLSTLIPLPSAVGAVLLFRLILTLAEASLALPLLLGPVLARSGMMRR